MPTTSTPTRGERFILPAWSSPYTNAVDMPVFVTFAKRSATPISSGSHVGGCEDGDDGWYIEYRTEHEGPIMDENTPGLHTIFLSDKQAARNAKYHETVELLREDPKPRTRRSVCNICKTNPVAPGVHACEVCE